MAGNAQSGGRGTRQKTRQEHERAGTFRKDRHAELKTPEPPSGRPETPDLGEVERAEWDRMMVRLELSQSLAVVDDAAIYQYCKLYAETEHVAVQQDEMKAGLGVLEENLSSRPETPEERLSATDKVQLFTQIVTLHKLVSKCTDQLRQGRMALRQYLVEFGLTPASRGRVKLPAKQDQVDEFTAYQKKRTA